MGKSVGYGMTKKAKRAIKKSSSRVKDARRSMRNTLLKMRTPAWKAYKRAKKKYGKAARKLWAMAKKLRMKRVVKKFSSLKSKWSKRPRQTRRRRWQSPIASDTKAVGYGATKLRRKMSKKLRN